MQKLSLFLKQSPEGGAMVTDFWGAIYDNTPKKTEIVILSSLSKSPYCKKKRTRICYWREIIANANFLKREEEEEYDAQK